MRARRLKSEDSEGCVCRDVCSGGNRAYAIRPILAGTVDSLRADLMVTKRTSSMVMHRPTVPVEWICNSCGKVVLNSAWEGMRGMEAHMWVVCHFKGGVAGNVWMTRRYCPECAEKVCATLNVSEDD